jgi:hypothetical protein
MKISNFSSVGGRFRAPEWAMAWVWVEKMMFYKYISSNPYLVHIHYPTLPHGWESRRGEKYDR